MRNLAWASLFALVGAASAPAAPITTLYSTGVNDAGVPLTNGTPERHYTLIPGSRLAGTPFVRTSAGGFPIDPFGPWVPDNAQSAWVTPLMTNDEPSGRYIYRTTFDLTGFDPATASVSGLWSTDNWGMDVVINGVSTGQRNDDFQFRVFRPFAVTTGFRPGINTLDFHVDQEFTVSGLRVQITSAQANLLPTATVPEPTALAAFGLLAVGALAGRVRRRK